MNTHTHRLGVDLAKRNAEIQRLRNEGFSIAEVAHILGLTKRMVAAKSTRSKKGKV